MHPMLPTVRTTRCRHQSNNQIIINSSSTGKNMRPGTRLWGFLGIQNRIYASRDAGLLNLSQVVASVFHFRIVNTPPAAISILFRKCSARQLSENTIMKRVYWCKPDELELCRRVITLKSFFLHCLNPCHCGL